MSSKQENNSDSVCLITGGTSGIGLATVSLFQRHGYRIATCGRERSRLDLLRNGLLADSSRHYVAEVDLEQVDQTRRFADTVVSGFERVDVLVNNAAAAPLVPFDKIDDETFERLVNVNVRSPFYLTRRIWSQMKKQGRGLVVNISSLAAVDPFPGFSIYGASKAWSELLTTALAAEGRSDNIGVYSIRAGTVETPLLRRLFPDFPPEQCVSPEVVAEAIWRFVDAEHEFSPGQPVVVAKQK